MPQPLKVSVPAAIFYLTPKSIRSMKRFTILLLLAVVAVAFFAGGNNISSQSLEEAKIESDSIQAHDDLVRQKICQYVATCGIGRYPVHYKMSN